MSKNLIFIVYNRNTFSKCYFITDNISTKRAAKGIKRSHANSSKKEYLEALYENKVNTVNYNVLNFQKDKTCICLKNIAKPALNPIYTKMRLTNKVICTPHE